AQKLAEAIHFSLRDGRPVSVFSYYSSHYIRAIHTLFGTLEQRGEIPEYPTENFRLRFTALGELGLDTVETFQRGKQGSLALGMAIGVPMSIGGSNDEYRLSLNPSEPL